MARLIDTLREMRSSGLWRFGALGPEEPTPEDMSAVSGWLKKAVPDAVPFVVDNVSQWFYCENDQDIWRFDQPEHFRCLRPPYDVCWIETRAPAGMIRVAGEPPREWGDRPYAWGMFLVTTDDVDGMLRFHGVPAPAGAKWVVSALVIAQSRRHDEAVIPVAYFDIVLDEQGAFLPLWPGRTEVPGRALLARGMPIEQERDEITAAVGYSEPLWKAIDFMHAKNVDRYEVEPRQTRKRRRQNKPPLSRYWTLRIGAGLRGVTRRVSEEEHERSGVALHICRGHFKHYTEEAPLFGKYAGTWFWPAQVRGRRTAGTVTKDYEVDVPQEAS